MCFTLGEYYTKICELYNTMESTIKDKEKSQKEISVTIPVDEMKEYAEKAVELLSKDVEAKGFRKGKAPKDIAEKYLGESKIWEQAAEDAFGHSYAEVVKEHQLQVISSPRVEVLKLAPGNEFTYRATVAILPEIKLPDISAVAKTIRKKEKREIELSDKEIDGALNWLVKSRSGTKLDDEFAKSVGDFKNVEELRKNVGDGLRREKEAKEKERIHLLILKEIAKKASLEISDILIDEEKTKMLRELEQRVEQMGLTLEEYEAQIKKSRKEIMEGWDDGAKDRVEAGLILRAIEEDHEIKVDDDELEKRVNQYLQHYKTPEEAEKALGDVGTFKSYVRGLIRNEKIFTLLDNNSK